MGTLQAGGRERARNKTGTNVKQVGGSLMYGFFHKPVARFVAGAVVACFFLMPVVLVVFGLPTSLWFLAPFLIGGVAGGVWWMRRPPAIMYKQPADASLHATGVFSKPSARFLTGFISASLIFVSLTWLTKGSLRDWSFLPAMVAVGIFCGVMGVRSSARSFSRHRPT